jgi:ketosteroid isomerase-like protein
VIHQETEMTTRETIEGYFRRLVQRNGWDAFLSDDVAFTSLTSPVKRLSGRAAYLESTKRFYSMIKAVEVRDLMVDGQRACALTHYCLEPPGRAAFESDVAEVFGVRDGKISSMDIYFDSAPYPK